MSEEHSGGGRELISDPAAKVEILVPRTHEWWTFLALATEPYSSQKAWSFVSKISPFASTLLIDSNLLRSNLHQLQGKSHVMIILWDGRASYQQCFSDLMRTRPMAAKVELLFVGDLPPANDSIFSSRFFFAQNSNSYDKGCVGAQLKTVSFARLFSKAALKYRSQLVSAKVALQLVRHGRLREYNRTRFVYCGHSGLSTLQMYSSEFGVPDFSPSVRLTNGLCDSQLCNDWLSALHRKGGHWADRIVIRALLRFLALRTIMDFRAREIFLNIYPAVHINVYQAGILFKHHIFLDFGGTFGDEAIYPRSADLLFHERKVLRFDFQSAASEMKCLIANPCGLDAFLQRFQSWILAQFDGARPKA